MDAETAMAEQVEEAKDGHDPRLMALLSDMAGKLGRKGVARLLDVDHRTVGACLESGVLSRRVEAALQRMLEARERAPEEKRQGANSEALVERLEAMEQGLEETRESVDGRFLALRREHGQALFALARRLSVLETKRDGRAAANPAREEANGQGEAEPAFWREHPDLVIWEAAPEDEAVYGTAWPLVDEWRRLWAGHPAKGKGLPWLMAEERIRELEVAMMEEHGLTLPPEKEPLREMWRSSQLRWRKRALDRLRRERTRRERIRWVRRALTLGLWWE